MNPFTNSEYSEEYFKLQEVISEFPAAKPEVLKKFDKLYSKHNTVIVKAATGAGKGVVIAPHVMMLENVCAGKLCGPNKVVVTEPRTTNTQIADYIKRVVDTPAIVNYAFSFNDNLTSETLLAFVTDGFLLNFFYKDPKLSQYKTIIIDEVHERSKNIDMLLCFTKRANKKCVILSATINPKEYSGYFKDAGVLEIPGVTHAITHHYLDTEPVDYIAAAIDIIAKTTGSVLIFLASQYELQDACKRINEFNKKNNTNYVCFELSRTTPNDVRKTIVDKNSTNSARKIIFATNIAESGITISELDVVIDSCKRYEVKFDADEGIPIMNMEWISKAEAEQRAGRVGRTKPGICYHLHSKTVYDNLPEQKTPEIAITDVSDLLFKLMITLTLKEAKEFMAEMLTPPTTAQINYAVELLTDLLLINGEKITSLGSEVARIPLDPNLAISLLSAKKLGVEHDTCLLFSMLAIEPSLEKWFSFPAAVPQKVRSSIFSKWKNAKGELYAMHKIMKDYLDKKDKKKFCYDNFIPFTKMYKAERKFFKFINTAKTLNTSVLGGVEADTWTKVVTALMRGFSRNIAIATGDGKYHIFRSKENITRIDDTKFSTKLSKYLFYFSIARVKGELKFGGITNLSKGQCESLQTINRDFYKKIERLL